MITYTQEITFMDVNNENPETPNLITAFHVTLSGIDDTDNLSSSIGVMIGFEPPRYVNPISDLTKEVAESWIEGDSRLEYAKGLLASNIETIRASAVKSTLASPWSASTVDVAPSEIPPVPETDIPTIQIQKVVV